MRGFKSKLLTFRSPKTCLSLLICWITQAEKYCTSILNVAHLQSKKSPLCYFEFILCPFCTMEQQQQQNYLLSITESFNPSKHSPLYKNEQNGREILQWRLLPIVFSLPNNDPPTLFKHHCIHPLSVFWYLSNTSTSKSKLTYN